jgi:hypothetical protein
VQILSTQRHLSCSKLSLSLLQLNLLLPPHTDGDI